MQGPALQQNPRSLLKYSRHQSLTDPLALTAEELLRAVLYEQEALRRVLVRKGLVNNEEVLEEVKGVRRELEGKRGR